MWSGFDPQIVRELEALRELVKRRQQSPLREWPLLYNEQDNTFFVVREWPDGTITAVTVRASNATSR